jgi:hypothetical protein
MTERIFPSSSGENKSNSGNKDSNEEQEAVVRILFVGDRM